jgi:hypothetical protein
LPLKLSSDNKALLIQSCRMDFGKRVSCHVTFVTLVAYNKVSLGLIGAEQLREDVESLTGESLALHPRATYETQVYRVFGEKGKGSGL